MYHLMGFRRNLRNVMALAHYRPPAGRSADLIAVAAAYRAYLRTIQPGFTVSTQPTTEIVVDPRMARRLVAFGYSKSEDQDVRRLRASLRRRAQEPARDAKLRILSAGLRGLFRSNPEISRLFHIVITRIFYYELPDCRGGSTPEAYGLVFANPDSEWTRVEAIEFLVHEMTHNLVFLDEECSPHYADYRRVNAKKNYAYSAIRRQKRRLDLAMHSLIVSTELLLLRERTLGHPLDAGLHPSSPALVASCRDTIGSIKSLDWRSLLAPRGRAILAACESANLQLRRAVSSAPQRWSA